MEEEIGEVLDARYGKAKVKLKDVAGCSRCPMALLCSSDDEERILEVNDPIGVKPGQQVRITVDASASIIASFIVFILPLIFLIVGALVGELIWSKFMSSYNHSVVVVVFAFVFLIDSFISLRMLNPYFERKKIFTPRIKEIIE